MREGAAAAAASWGWIDHVHWRDGWQVDCNVCGELPVCFNSVKVGDSRLAARGITQHVVSRYYG